ncbi:MAG: Bro-N domain-containing protein [Bilophila wadsworthia]
MKMSNITPFAFGDNLVRSMTDENGNPWFVAKDVCRVLCIENNRDAISTLDEDEKITVANPDGNPRAGIPHQYVLISESGLYALVFRSRKPEAKAFSKWVRSEVLPTLRKTGKYEMPRQTRREALPDDLPSGSGPASIHAPEAVAGRFADRPAGWWRFRGGAE